MAKVIIPTPLRKFTHNQGTINTDGGTIKENIVSLAEQFPDLKKHIFDENGDIRKFIRIYLGDEDINVLDKENTKVLPDSVVSIIPAIAGGKN
ncbi:MAG: MoaD/ThiS family protein [Bacteroidetes bacterium]|nr:MoaD/ThiS family protein [Bacteroidota bacterium]MDA1121607.1 MoaD/ThiS family protein [Bacteroidota bacterium]